MRVVVGSDHAGFGLKEFLKIELQKLGHEIVDVGTYDESPCDYPDFGFKAAKFVSEGQAEKGILVCGTGIGMCVVANKVKKIRAALVYDLYGAIQSRKHLNSNVLVLGARMTAKELALEIVKMWLDTEFDGGRHAQRIKKIEEWEKRCSLEN